MSKTFDGGTAQVKEYPIPSNDNVLTPNFNGLNEAHKHEMIKVGRSYMDKIEQIRCPSCPVCNKYEDGRGDCRDCWYKVLDKLCKETIESEGWHDGFHVVK